MIPPYLQSWEGLANLEGLDVGLVQCLTLGYDGVAEFLPKNMVFANAASVHEPSTAEMTLALILASQRYIPDFVRAAEAGTWAPSWHPSLADRTVLLVGYGGVGRAIESRLLPFESDGRATRSSRARRRTRSRLRHRLIARVVAVLPTSSSSRCCSMRARITSSTPSSSR